MSILQNSEISIPIAVIQLPEEVDAKVRAKTPEILEITEIEDEKVSYEMMHVYMNLGLNQ